MRLTTDLEMLRVPPYSSALILHQGIDHLGCLNLYLA